MTALRETYSLAMGTFLPGESFYPAKYKLAECPKIFGSMESCASAFLNAKR
jgi:hypothetical protein